MLSQDELSLSLMNDVIRQLTVWN